MSRDPSDPKYIEAVRATSMGVIKLAIHLGAIHGIPSNHLAAAVSTAALSIWGGPDDRTHEETIEDTKLLCDAMLETVKDKRSYDVPCRMMRGALREAGIEAHPDEEANDTPTEADVQEAHANTKH